MTILSLLGLQQTPKWVNRNGGDNMPTKPGWYRVIINGDSETEGPHVYYAYDDYETWANFWIDKDDPDDTGTFNGVHDEETDMVFAWCGPYVIPDRGRT